MEIQRVEAAGAGVGAGEGSAVRSRCRVQVRESRWRVHQWEVSAGGSVLCRAAALRTGGGGLLVWVGAGHAPAALGAVAVGMPARRRGDSALSSVLSGAASEGSAEAAAALARRLAAALHRPVHVCCAAAFDRFTAPLVERGLVAEIKSRPECFVDVS